MSEDTTAPQEPEGHEPDQAPDTPSTDNAPLSVGARVNVNRGDVVTRPDGTRSRCGGTSYILDTPGTFTINGQTLEVVR